MAEAPVERRLAAILAADVFGYSRLMGTDEEGTLAALKAHRARTDCWLKGHLALELIVRCVRFGRYIDDFTDRTNMNFRPARCDRGTFWRHQDAASGATFAKMATAVTASTA